MVTPFMEIGPGFSFTFAEAVLVPVATDTTNTPLSAILDPLLEGDPGASTPTNIVRPSSETALLMSNGPEEKRLDLPPLSAGVSGTYAYAAHRGRSVAGVA